MTHFGYVIDIVLNIQFVTKDKGTRTPFTTVFKCGNLKQLACIFIGKNVVEREKINKEQ